MVENLISGLYIFFGDVGLLGLLVYKQPLHTSRPIRTSEVFRVTNLRKLAD